MLQAGMMMVVALAGADIGAPPPFHPLAHTAQQMDLDTTPGHFSEWKTQDLEGVNAIRARFRVRYVGKDNRWIGAFNFTLQNGRSFVRLSISGMAGKPLLLVQMQQGSGAAPAADPQPSQMQLDEVADLAIDWDKNGQATFWIKSTDPNSPLARARVATLDLGGAPATFSVSSSTGELELMSLALGASD